MNYKDTVFLPRTDFPMRGGQRKKGPPILQNWHDIDIYKKLREARKDAPRFTLHDGPPYANGQLHIGHALNKILKDMYIDGYISLDERNEALKEKVNLNYSINNKECTLFSV